MTGTLMDEDKIIANLEQAFSVNKMILFVGKDNPKDVITKDVARLPWSCIITSSREDSFRDLFSEQQRQIREWSILSDIPANIFEGNTLPIIKLFGKDISGLADEDIDIQQEVLEDECNRMLSNVMHKLDFTMQLIILGYHPGIEEEIKRTTFIIRLQDCGGAKITFFGLNYDDEETGKLKLSLEKYKIEFYDESLGNMLSRQEIDSFGSSMRTATDDEELFYKNGKPVTIKQSNLLRYKEVGMLLTENLINTIRPYGRTQQSRWFLNFLTRSFVDGPQWYGYLNNSEFYLKRNYEEPLLKLVSDILKGKDGVVKDYSNPVILEGNPSSGKSVELGALAYKIFIRKETPVIFIDKNRLNTREDIEALDDFMQEIEYLGDHDSKILIIWDASSYQNITTMARGIAKQLDNRGRRFLLVCSSYRNLDYMTGKRSKYHFLRFNGKAIERCDQDSMEIAQDIHSGSYYIHASDFLDDKELLQLRNKVNLYIPELKNELMNKWKALEKEGNRRLFDYLYKLIVVLQPPLELGLDREKKIFVQYAQKLLNEAGAETDIIEINPMRDALLQLGFEPNEIDAIGEDDNEFSEEDIHRMNVCIALFSRFKLDCSVRMAIYILRSQTDQNAYEEVYSSKNRKILDSITSSMPWIIYKPNADNVFCLYYRSALEAEIFLTNHNVSPENEIDMICEMLDFYAWDYMQNASSDLSLKEALQKLIRMIGPNSDYFSFSWNDSFEHKGLMEHLDKIIEKLYWLRTEIRIEDDDASFANLEITFLREFYGTNWNREKTQELKNAVSSGNAVKPWEAYPDTFTKDSYILRLKKLNMAIDLSNSCIDRLQNINKKDLKQSVANTINSMIVELSLCNIRLEDLQNEFLEFCKSTGIEAQTDLKEIKPMQYNLLYRLLLKAVNADPLNGYVYNAIFRLFKKEYDKSDDSRRIELLSAIGPVVDNAQTYEIENRGPAERDELTENISIIRNYSSKVKVSIRDLDTKQVDKKFLSLFDDMIERGNASVITFVCQQELDSAGLTTFRKYDYDSGENIINKLTNYQLLKCKEICEFMNREEYATCVENDANALYLQLKVTWMAYNGYPIMDGIVECRPTFLSKEKWIEINRLCRLYDQCAGKNKIPVVVLLQALSLIHISGDFKEANRLLESLREDMFISAPRMRVPYLLCDDEGHPILFAGKVLQTDDQRHRGFIQVDNVPLHLGNKIGVRFYQKNLGRKSMPKQNDIIKDLEMGIGYMGFSLYTETGRNRLEVR